MLLEFNVYIPNVQERNIADLLKKYDEVVHPVGEGLTEDVRIYRIKVLG